MLQLFVLLILCSVNEVKWVAAESAADQKYPKPTPTFTSYDDFQERHKEYNTSLYYISSRDDKIACACQEHYVICYTQRNEKIQYVQYTNGSGTVITHNEFDCIACLAQPKVLFKQIKCNPDLQFPLSKYLFTVVSDYMATDRRFITSDLAIVQNFSNVTQTAMTTSYAKEVSESVTVTFSAGVKVSASAAFKVPYVSEVKLGFEISASTSRTQTRGTKATVTAPPQPISLPPNRTIAVHYSIYSVKLKSKSLLNFQIEYRKDLKNNKTDPDRFDDIERGTRFNHYTYNFLPNPYGAGLVFTKDRQFELKNFPAEQMKNGHSLIIDISPDKATRGTEEHPGPYDDELMQRPQKSSFKKSSGTTHRRT